MNKKKVKQTKQDARARADATLAQVEAAIAQADARTEGLRSQAAKAHDKLLREKERLAGMLDAPADTRTRQAREDAYLKTSRRLTLANSAIGVADTLKIGE